MTDSGGAVAHTAPQQVVVYAAGAPVVAGSGWIESPAGAYLRRPDLAGRASFAFLAQPAENRAELHFEFEKLSFRSDAFECPALDKGRTQCAGVGTLDGEGGYGFQVTALDSDAGGGEEIERFRLRIWELESGKTVYESQPNADDDPEAAAPIDGGAIVVQL